MAKLMAFLFSTAGHGSAERHLVLLPDVLRHSRRADNDHLHDTSYRPGTLPFHLLLCHFHKDEPDIEDIQPGNKKHQKAVVHVAQIAGRHLSGRKIRDEEAGWGGGGGEREEANVAS
ncbi:hypothetical protein RUM43_011852 [Polyplax serrata]|uniref:Uncharacterized protein n=1 Tax=Polyplax serrata TaxID=468196 RepID=A0AAN8P2R5_POLSC